jgi:hypothetical protein
MLLLAGCQMLIQRGPGAPQDSVLHLNYRNASYCRDDLGRGDGSYVTHSTDLSDEIAVAERFRRVMCDPHPDPDYHDTIYARLGGDPFDHFDAAFMIVACVGSGECDPNEQDRGNSRFSWSKTADFAWYAQRIRADEVWRTVAHLPAPKEVRDAFMARAEACRRHVAGAAASFDRRRAKVYVRTIDEVRHRRRADEVALAPYLERFVRMKPALDRALLDGEVTSKHLEHAVSLRDEYVDACIDRLRPPAHCVGGPVARPLGELIVRLAAARGDAIRAHAEYAALTVPDVTDVRAEIHLAVDAAMAEETESYRAWVRAKELGTDASVLAAKFGDPPPLDLGDYGNGAGIDPPRPRDLSRELDQLERRAVRLSGPVTAVERQGSRVRITIQGYETVDVPQGEGAPVKAGEWIDLFADAQRKTAHVVFVRKGQGRDGALVQVRAWRRASK